ARTLDQCCQDLQGTAAETNGSVTFQQKLLRRKEAEGTERNCTLGRGGGLLGQFDLALPHLTSINLTNVRAAPNPRLYLSARRRVGLLLSAGCAVAICGIPGNDQGLIAKIRMLGAHPRTLGAKVA